MQVVPELVEADLPVGEVCGLLESRALAGRSGDSTVLVKRQDGSTVPITVNPAEGLAHLETRIAQQEVCVEGQGRCGNVFVYICMVPKVEQKMV